MGYDVNASNSKKFFGPDGLRYALACCYLEDYDNYRVGIFYWDGAQWDATIPLIMENVTSTVVLSFDGTTAGFLKHILPLATEHMKALFGPTKPDQTNKPACAGYDLVLDVDYDPITMNFTLNKSPPLSHASP